MKTQTGRIENEHADIYFGEHDKPAYGSSALKCWIADQDEFYRRYIKRDIPQPDLGQYGKIGNAVEEVLLENRERRFLSQFKTPCAGQVKEQAEHPDMIVLSRGDFEVTQLCIDAGMADPYLYPLVEAGKAQVTYRVDMGPFYLQARIDLEVDNDSIPEQVFNGLQLSYDTEVLLVDLKTTRTLIGRDGFERAALRAPLHYPVQAEFYRQVVALAEGAHVSKFPFRFCAIGKDGSGVRWYDMIDVDDRATNKVLSAIGELKHRHEVGDWADFESRFRQVIVPEHYLNWS